MRDNLEGERARIVEAHDVAGALASGMLDDLTDFAAKLCDAPVALVTLIAGEYQQFAAHHGVVMDTMPRDATFCNHALGSDAVTVVPDPLLDPRFADLPVVTGPPFVRFYAGAPLLSSEGVALGSLCVLDLQPRVGLTPLQHEGLVVLAKAAMGRLDDRRAAREQAVIEAASRRALEESDLKFRTLADTMPQMVWSTRADGYHDYYNARWYAFTGVPVGSTDGRAWEGLIHPDDRERTWTAWSHSLATGEPYSIEYRVRAADGGYRWLLGRALPMRDEAGGVKRWFGTCTDIHEQKEAQEEREVISQELSHRIKNIFAVISGLISLAARNRPDFAMVATDLRQRVTALGRAHDFVRPHSLQSRPHAQQDSLHGLLGDLFEPYQQVDAPRIRVEGDDIAIDDRSATPLALLFHELATNATKYGALSSVSGGIVVATRVGAERATLRWVESGGPAPAAPAGAGGFGTQLVELSAVRQLGGTVDRDWRAEGLVVTIAVPLTALRRG